MGEWILKYKSENIDLCLKGDNLEKLIDEGILKLKVAYKAYHSETRADSQTQCSPPTP